MSRSVPPATDPALGRLRALLSRRRTGRMPVVLQSEAAECGLACLAMIASHHGHEVDLGALRRRLPVSLKGTSLADMLDMAGRLGLAGRGLRLEPSQLGQLRPPAILHWDMSHFVVLRAAARGGAISIHDPALGARRIPADEVARRFTGIALELSPAHGFERRSETRRLRAASLWGRMDGMGRALAQAGVLTAVLQAAALAPPFYMQVAVDEAVGKGDGRLLGALTLGFSLLVAIRFGAEWLRARVLASLGAALGYQMVANLAHHLLRLPLDFFEKRHVGDMVSRFGSIRPVREAIAEWAVTAAVDGVMALGLLVAMVAYSPLLAGVACAALAGNAALRLSALPELRAREGTAVHAWAREQGVLIETVRAAQAVKVFGREGEREALWRNRAAEAAGQEARTERLRGGLKACADALYGAENLLVVYLGARYVIGGALTVGMLFAFAAWRQQFLDKATRLLETAVRWRMLDLHLDRISDIAHAEREPGLDAVGWRGEAGGAGTPLIEHALRGALELRDVSFRYALTEADVIAGVNLAVTPGEFLAITGPSGGGKTTLLKVLLGLFRATTGSVLVDGVPLERIGPVAFRAQVGVVMQDDRLLSGTLAENLTFFDPQPEWDWMRACARDAGVDGEIMAMPMNYNTLVGDMGAALSGGQRQRVLLARALYRRPRILFMDEGTSHLDVAKEREVNQALAALRITRVVIAHRPETVSAADRVVALQGGRIVSDLRQKPAGVVRQA